MKHLLPLLFIALPIINGQDCIWNRDTDFSKNPSLLMNARTWQSYLPVLDGSERVIRISDGSVFYISCPGSTISATGSGTEKVSCSEGSVSVYGEASVFFIPITYMKTKSENKFFDMEDLGCTSKVSESVSSSLTSLCGHDGRGITYSIGYEITNFYPYELVSICFDPSSEIAIYTTHLLRGESVDASDGNSARPSFKTGFGVYSVSPNTCYKIDSQEDLMEEILGDSSVIDESSSLYFARGHLSPDADFLTEMEADATYYYVNAVPQWQAINNGNWKHLEAAVRNLASSHGTDFQIWTGTYGVLELDDTNGNPVPIYLGLCEGEEVIPAPLSLWKVICDTSSDKCLGVVMSNNPYLESFPSPMCDDICNEISWITFDTNDLHDGATYCCTVQDLHDAIPDAPYLPSSGLLNG